MGPNPILRRKHLPKSKWSSFGRSSRNKREARSLGGRPKQISGRSWGSPNWALTQWGAWLGSWSWSISERVKGSVTGADAILLEQCLVSPPDLLHVANVCPSREKTGRPRHRWVPVKQWFFVVWELFQRIPEELNIFQFSKPKNAIFPQFFVCSETGGFRYALSFRNCLRNTFCSIFLNQRPKTLWVSTKKMHQPHIDPQWEHQALILWTPAICSRHLCTSCCNCSGQAGLAAKVRPKTEDQRPGAKDSYWRNAG